MYIQSKSICVVAICGGSSFAQYGQLKSNWNSVFALMDKVNCKRFFCVRLDTYKVFSLLDIGRMFCIASWWKGCNKSDLVLDRLFCFAASLISLCQVVFDFSKLLLSKSVWRLKLLLVRFWNCAKMTWPSSHWLLVMRMYTPKPLNTYAWSSFI